MESGTGREASPGPGAALIKIGGAGACHSDLHVMEEELGFKATYRRFWLVKKILRHALSARSVDTCRPQRRGCWRLFGDDRQFRMTLTLRGVAIKLGLCLPVSAKQRSAGAGRAIARMMNALVNEFKGRLETIKGWRHHLHKHPGSVTRRSRDGKIHRRVGEIVGLRGCGRRRQARYRRLNHRRHWHQVHRVARRHRRTAIPGQAA